jgi:hypothetical protein
MFRKEGDFGIVDPECVGRKVDTALMAFLLVSFRPEECIAD